MDAIGRRTFLGYSALAAAALAGPATAADGAAKASDKPAPAPPGPTPTNALATRPYLFTMVAPDLDASIRFYCGLLDYELIGRGKLGGHLPTVAGVGAAGRRYALVKGSDAVAGQHGFLRLLEAPKDALPNRPRPDSTPLDPGLAMLEALCGDTQQSYDRLTKAGIKTITPPLQYYHDKVTPFPGASDAFSDDFVIKTFAAIGPGGEQLFISRLVSMANKPPAPWTSPKLHGGFNAMVITTLDRWPLWDFYEKSLGLKPTKDMYSSQDNLNQLIGAPKASYYRFGSMGDAAGIEWWEFRQRRPPGNVLATALDKTGIAMATLIVDDLDHVRANIGAAGIAPVGEGALPLPEGKEHDGLYLRGSVGELIEVVGRG